MRKVQGPRLTFARFLTVVFAGVAIFMVINLGQGWLMNQSALRELQNKAQVVQSERDQRDSLMQAAKAAEQPASAAETIREELGWGRRDEGSAILQFQGWPPPAGRGGSPQGREDAAPPYWLDWLSAFLLP
jgi:hypothetical protein